MLRKVIANLTAQQAWDIYVSTSEKLFLSNFRLDTNPIYATELKKMCDRYVADIPAGEGKLFTTDELDHISNLLVEHLKDYINGLGGIDKIEYYTEEDLKAIAKQEWEDIIRAIMKRYGVTRKVAKAVFERRWYNDRTRQ